MEQQKLNATELRGLSRVARCCGFSPQLPESGRRQQHEVARVPADESQQHTHARSHCCHADDITHSTVLIFICNK